MRLTTFTDYALRMMIMASQAEMIRIEEVARSLSISRNHLMKVSNLLTRKGLLVAKRGRAGGLRLARPAHAISVGEIVRATEPDFDLVGCLAGLDCGLSDRCRLPSVLAKAIAAFFGELDRTSLAALALSGLALIEAQPSVPSVG